MQVIRHQAITDQPHSMEFDVLAQKIEIRHAIGIATQDKSPRTATLCYVVRNIYSDDLSQTRHNENPSFTPHSLRGTLHAKFRGDVHFFNSSLP
jgi:hypothetical protein